MLEHYNNNKISLEKIVRKMCHNPAILFEIKDRGFIREGYFADLVIVDLNRSGKLTKKIFYISAIGHLLKDKILNQKYCKLMSMED